MQYLEKKLMYIGSCNGNGIVLRNNRFYRRWCHYRCYRPYVPSNIKAKLVNISIGFIQEYKAEKTMDSLRQLSSPTGAVLRNSEIESVPSITIVPGDIVSLKTGDVVPADVRLFESMNFETDEALLTGESLPVPKSEQMY